MTPRAFLVRGLVVGLLAGLAAFLTAYTVGEPQIDAAIALEEAGAAPAAAEHSHAEDEAAHSHADDEEEAGLSRGLQKTAGLLTGTVAVAVALGGIVALLSATAVGRLGRLTATQSTLVVTLVGFIAFALVPFLKYPPNPPAVGSGETIGSRTALYFAFLLISIAAAVAAVVVSSRVWRRVGAFHAVAGAAVAYVVVMVVAGNVLPTVNEVGDFPADTLWFFRLSSLYTLLTTWTVIGLGLAWAAGRLQRQAAEAHARRELAQSL